MTDIATSLRRTTIGQPPQDVATVAVVNPDGSLVGGGGGSSGIGAPSDPAWGGTGDATVISLLKAHYALLVQIRDNTATS